MIIIQLIACLMLAYSSLCILSMVAGVANYRGCLLFLSLTALACLIAF